jgi:hypothetical protein
MELQDNKVLAVPRSLSLDKTKEKKVVVLATNTAIFARQHHLSRFLCHP